MSLLVEVVHCYRHVVRVKQSKNSFKQCSCQLHIVVNVLPCTNTITASQHSLGMLASQTHFFDRPCSSVAYTLLLPCGNQQKLAVWNKYMWVTEGSLKFSFGNIGTHLVLSSCLLRPTYNHSHTVLASGSSETKPNLVISTFHKLGSHVTAKWERNWEIWLEKPVD